MIDEETFVGIIDEIRETEKWVDALNDFIGNYGCDGTMMPPTCTYTVINLLEDMFQDENECIPYFIYDLNYGEDWAPGCFTYKGEDVKVSNANELYNYLLKIMKGE